MLFPAVQSDQLDIKVILPLAHGGHSFVFKVSTNGGTGVLKIFRYPDEATALEALDPYLYFNREVEAYARLIERGASFCPRIISTVLISAEEEKTLESHMNMYWTSMYRRKAKATQEELPLKALLMEWVDGNRLTGDDLTCDSVLQVELQQAVEKMHACGVAWGDAKWRNILVRSEVDEGTTRPDSDSNGTPGGEVQTGGRLVLLDYSNACHRPPVAYDGEGGQGASVNAEEWETIKKNECEVIRYMIESGKIFPRRKSYLNLR